MLFVSESTGRALSSLEVSPMRWTTRPAPSESEFLVSLRRAVSSRGRDAGVAVVSQRFPQSVPIFSYASYSSPASIFFSREAGCNFAKIRQVIQGLPTQPPMVGNRGRGSSGLLAGSSPFALPPPSSRRCVCRAVAKPEPFAPFANAGLLPLASPSSVLLLLYRQKDRLLVCTRVSCADQQTRNIVVVASAAAGQQRDTPVFF